MALDLTNVYASINNIKRGLFFDTSIAEFNTLIFKNVDVTLATITTDFYISKNATSKTPTSNEERRLSFADIADSIDFDTIIPLTTNVIYGEEGYKLKQFTRPRGVTRKYKIVLEATGE